MRGRFGVLIPIGRLKWIDTAALAARFAGVGRAKQVTVDERPASWSRVLRLLDKPVAHVDAQLRILRTALAPAKLRLFRSFKLLGRLKREAPAATVSVRPAAPRRRRFGRW